MSISTDSHQDGQALDTLLKKTQQTPSKFLLSEELTYLLTAFLSTQPAAIRSKAYLILSAFCEGVRSSSAVKGKQPDPATETLVKVFGPQIVSRLADTEETTLLAGITFLTALFQVDRESASSVFQQDGVLEYVMDSVDLTPSPQLSLDVAHLLGQACGHKACRAAITPQPVRWLEITSRRTTDPSLRAAAAVALIKLSKGTVADNSETTAIEVSTRQDNGEDLADVMRGMVISGDDQSSLADAVEGLAYLSVDPVVKESLSGDPAFLKRLFALVSHRKSAQTGDFPATNSTLVYGIIIITSNLCAHRPRLTEEQAQIDKLKRMAKAGKGPADLPLGNQFALDDDERVQARARRLVAAGVVDVFAAAVSSTESLGIRVATGKVLLDIIEDKDNRGKVLQSGGAKVLTSIIKHATTSTSKASPLDATYLQPIQALAKLAITSSPVQVFGPNVGASYDAIRPFSIMLQHDASSLLQRFEAMMALTNLSSQSTETASRIAQAEGLINKVEFLLLEENILVRRAAMELVCNLIAGSDEIFERYGGETNFGGTKSKLQIVLALSDVEDLATRLAASGALATLSTAPSACHALVVLQNERRRVLPILTQLIDPSTAQGEDREDGEMESHPGLVHRGIVCARNLLLSIADDPDARKRLSGEADAAGLLQALVNVAKGQLGTAGNEAILRPTAEALRVLMMDKTE